MAPGVTKCFSYADWILFAFYKIEGDVQTYQGAYLMDIGIAWPIHGSFKSKVLSVKMAN